MDEKDRFRNIVAVKPEKPDDFGDDPNAKHEESLKNKRSEELKTKRLEELDDATHKNTLWIHKVFRVLVISSILFLPVLFFVILPISQMTIDPNSPWKPFQDWSLAFLATSRTAGIALAALIVSDLIKRIFSYIVKRANTKD